MYTFYYEVFIPIVYKNPSQSGFHAPDKIIRVVTIQWFGLSRRFSQGTPFPSFHCKCKQIQEFSKDSHLVESIVNIRLTKQK